MLEDVLRYKIMTCHACPLGTLRDNTGKLSVPADVGANYRKRGLAILAEAPGKDEADVGMPFIGKAGQVLMAVLAEAGLARQDVLLLNRIRCRPPGNKIASKEGIAALAACDPWLIEELATYDPSVVLLMGGTAIGEIMGKKMSVGKIRGAVRSTGSDYHYGSRRWVATAHPAATLYGDGGKEHWLPLIYQDVLLAKDLVEVR